MQPDRRGRGRRKLVCKGVPALGQFIQPALEVGSAQTLRNCLHKTGDLALHPLELLFLTSPTGVFRTALAVGLFIDSQDELVDWLGRQQTPLQRLQDQFFQVLLRMLRRLRTGAAAACRGAGEIVLAD